jgi:hypothetical protein
MRNFWGAAAKAAAEAIADANEQADKCIPDAC